MSARVVCRQLAEGQALLQNPACLPVVAIGCCVKMVVSGSPLDAERVWCPWSPEAYLTVHACGVCSAVRYAVLRLRACSQFSLGFPTKRQAAPGASTVEPTPPRAQGTRRTTTKAVLLVMSAACRTCAQWGTTVSTACATRALVRSTRCRVAVVSRSRSCCLRVRSGPLRQHQGTHGAHVHRHL